MAGPRDGQDDRQVTDLARYRKARERARRQAAPPPFRPKADDGFLGSRPRAGMIFVLVVAVLTALYFAPKFMH